MIKIPKDESRKINKMVDNQFIKQAKKREKSTRTILCNMEELK